MLLFLLFKMYAPFLVLVLSFVKLFKNYVFYFWKYFLFA